MRFKRRLSRIDSAFLLSGIMLSSQIVGIASASARQGNTLVKPDLSVILKATAEYCRKLENVIFDFTCLEEIKETIDPLLDVLKPYEAGQPKKIRNTFSYDYQCIHQGGKIREKRILLEENGKKKNVPNAELHTLSLVFGNALLAPISIFAERNQPDYDYSIAGIEKINKIQLIVVEAKQKAGADNARCSYGKAWIEPTTAEIIKIEWRETHIGNWDLFEKRGEKFLRTPRLTMGSELKIEKNGMQFPNALNIEEAYVDVKGRAFVRSKVEVVYKDFKFFTVEVDIK